MPRYLVTCRYTVTETLEIEANSKAAAIEKWDEVATLSDEVNATTSGHRYTAKLATEPVRAARKELRDKNPSCE